MCEITDGDPSFVPAPDPTPPTDEELAAIERRIQNTTPGPWSWDESERVWQLFAEVTVQYTGHTEDGQEHTVCMVGHPLQLIKAPKQSQEYAEYWPSVHDSEFIACAREDLPRLLAEVRRLRALLAIR